MRRVRSFLWLGLLAILVAGYLILRSFGILASGNQARAKAVPNGDQEIAFIQAATSGSTWDKFVIGIQRVKKELPDLIVEDANAFPAQSAAVPEVALRLKGTTARLWIRWYKMTSEAGTEKWVSELARRQPSPLAIIGGGSSDRARDLARALAAQPAWEGTPPLLLITTATADNIYPRDVIGAQPLISIYPGRTFRFCFSNSQMAEALRDFIWSRDYLRPHGSPSLLLPGVAECAAGQPLAGLLLLAAGQQQQPYTIHVVEWQDDPYSVDLSNQFRNAFLTSPVDPAPSQSIPVQYSVGGFYKPNPREALGIKELMRVMSGGEDQRHLLVLSAVDKPARRWLRGLTVAAPWAVNNVVAVTGDSISFNTIYQDRNIAWNLQDMPFPLVFFCHQNPVEWIDVPPEPGTGDAKAAPSRSLRTGVDDELLDADIVQLLVEAAFVGADAGKPPQTGQTSLLASSDELAVRMRQQWPKYFGPDGNRRAGSGEYVVCLRPLIVWEDGYKYSATVEIWTRAETGPINNRWLMLDSLFIEYGQPGGGGVHGNN